VPVLPPGTYKVSIHAPGFATWRADDVEINVGSAAWLSVKLQIGTVAESVTVGASAAIDVSQTDVSSLVDRNAIHDLRSTGGATAISRCSHPESRATGASDCSASAGLRATSTIIWSRASPVDAHGGVSGAE
jgi:hypothetical protein